MRQDQIKQKQTRAKGGKKERKKNGSTTFFFFFPSDGDIKHRSDANIFAIKPS